MMTKALTACNGAPQDEIGKVLVSLHRSNQRPEKSWAWFPVMLRKQFAGRAV